MTASLRASLSSFGTTVFTTVTQLAIKHNAINLAQGFPDFDPPAPLVDAAVAALRAGYHQYPPSPGYPDLRAAIATHALDRYGLSYDPDTEVTVTTGATEAITCALQALTEPGDEVVILDPSYDLYPFAVTAAGCVPRRVPTTFPSFRVDPDRLAAAFGPKTRAIIVNTPWNPTGRILDTDELQLIGELAERHGAWILADEAYEHIVVGDRPHTPVARIPVCRDRTVTVSSVSKTLSATGWRIGWALAPAPLTAALRQVHQYVTFTAAAPLQRGVAGMLAQAHGAFYTDLRCEYRARRQAVLDILAGTDLTVKAPEGAYFVLARTDGDDVAYCEDLAERVGVAAIPASVFYENRADGRGLVRFAFCKKLETLRAAGERLAAAKGV